MDLRSAVPPLDASIDLREMYAPRPVEFLGIWRRDGWRLKVYGIAYGRDHVRRELVAAAETSSATVLPSVGDPGVTGIGFVILHDAEDGCYVLVARWQNAIEIHQRILFAESDDPSELRPLATAAIGCVYELAVTEFERCTWLDAVRRDPTAVDVEAYLATHLDEGRI